MKIGGSIKFLGKGLSMAKAMKGGGVELTFADQGSGEMGLKFSPENFKRLVDIALRFTVQHETFLSFEGDEGITSPEDFLLLLEDQSVTFSADGSDGSAGKIITIQIGNKADINSGLTVGLSMPQAEELVRRLQMFLESAKTYRAACKPKRIAASVQ